MTSHRLGGADRRLATGGVGSSPTGSVWPKTNSKEKLRRMLRDRDRILSHWDRLPDQVVSRRHIYGLAMKKVDDERKAIRCKLKSLRSAQ